MKINTNQVLSFSIAMMLACAIPTFAQELQLLVNDADIAVAEVDPVQDVLTVDNQYRIGLDCAPVSEALRVHLRLADGAGLLVNGVMSNSPAGRAGIQRFDIVVEADGAPVTSIGDLVRAVNGAKDTELSLAIVHEGEQQIVKVTPEKRDEEEIERLRNGFANRLGQNAWPPGMGPDFSQQIQRQIEQAMEQMKFGPHGGFRQFGPGIVLDNHQLPNGFNLKMSVERNNDGPATIKIERGDERWEVTEDNLNALPDDVRPMVENMLNGGRLNLQGLMAPNALPAIPAMPAMPAVPARPAAPQNDKRLQDRFDGLELKMQELQDAIRSIQGN